MELSGCDAVVVLPAADLDRAAEAISFALNFNSGATCIGPRRLIVASAAAERTLEKVRRATGIEPGGAGASGCPRVRRAGHRTSDRCGGGRLLRPF